MLKTPMPKSSAKPKNEKIASGRPRPEDVLAFKQFEEKVRDFNKGVATRVDNLNNRFKEYTELLDDKLGHLSIMQDYDVEFQLRQKFSDFWNTINSDRFSYLAPKDKSELERNLKELNDRLNQIEAFQLDQKHFIATLFKMLKQVNKSFNKAHTAEIGIQTDLLDGTREKDIEKYDNAIERYKYF